MDGAVISNNVRGNSNGESRWGIERVKARTESVGSGHQRYWKVGWAERNRGHAPRIATETNAFGGSTAENSGSSTSAMGKGEKDANEEGCLESPDRLKRHEGGKIPLSFLFSDIQVESI
jgi:hypothetical protein